MKTKKKANNIKIINSKKNNKQQLQTPKKQNSNCKPIKMVKLKQNCNNRIICPVAAICEVVILI